MPRNTEGGRPYRRAPRENRQRLHIRCRRCQHRRSLRCSTFQFGHHRGVGQARVFRGHDGRRVQPQRRRFGGSGGDLWRGRAQSRSGPWGIIRQPGAGVGIGGSARDHDGRSGQLSRHQWPQRFIECRGVIFCSVGLLPAGVDARRHRFGIARRYSGGANRRSGSIVAAQGYSAGEGRRQRLRR